MSTFRITGIHPSATKEDLVQFFESHQLQSRVFFVDASDGTKTATATLKKEDKRKLCKLSDNSLKLKDEVLTFDRTFLRFTTLYHGPNAKVE
jgi:hypothetical protein